MKNFSTLNEQLCFAVYEAHSAFTKLYAAVLQPFGLTYPQYLVLLALWEQDGLTMKELGRRLGLGTGTLTPMITRMQQGGWVRKRRSQEDERVVHVWLEEKAASRQPLIAAQIMEQIGLCGIEMEEYNELMNRLHGLQKKLTSQTGA